MKSNKFSLSHYKDLTGNLGELLPLTWYEVVPGDIIRMQSALLIRLQPLLAPVMHSIRVRVHHYFVPYRLLWEDWEDFITGGDDGLYTATVPYFALSAATVGSLHDYLDVPYSLSYSPALNVDAWAVRAYQTIWNEYYRDPDLNTEATVSLAAGADSTTDQTLQRVCWEKDAYITSRPWTQKGDEVTIPLLGDAPITGLGTFNSTYPQTSVSSYETDGTGTTTYANAKITEDSTKVHGQLYVEEDPDNSGFPNIRANLAAASGVSINDLRLAVAVQRFQEQMGMFGSRYEEYLRHVFRVRGSDARFQRPEFLGGGRATIQFSEVLTHSDSGARDVGDMTGHGIGAIRTRRWKRFFNEHGLVMSLLSLVPKAIYADGLHRKFYRPTKEDFYQPHLANIGDQRLFNKEIYAKHATPDGTFAYVPRYESYRHHPSGIAGEMNTTLNHWHMARQFASTPALNSTFVTCNPTTRIFQAPSADQVRVMNINSIQCRRMMVKYAKPGGLGN